MFSRLIAPILMAAAFIAVPAHAGEIDAAFGNTVRVTLPSGAALNYHYNADNTYVMVAPDGARVSGAWAIRDGELCTTPSGGAESCVALSPNRNVGDSWTQTEADGSTVNIAIVAGR